MYILHCPVSSAGLAIDWAKSIGLFNDYDEIEGILKSVNSSEGVYFVPAFGLLETDNVDKNSIATGFIGIRSNTKKAHMVRAIFDSIAFAIKLKMDMMLKDLNHYNISIKSIK